MSNSTTNFLAKIKDGDLVVTEDRYILMVCLKESQLIHPRFGNIPLNQYNKSGKYCNENLYNNNILGIISSSNTKNYNLALTFYAKGANYNPDDGYQLDHILGLVIHNKSTLIINNHKIEVDADVRSIVNTLKYDSDRIISKDRFSPIKVQTLLQHLENAGVIMVTIASHESMDRLVRVKNYGAIDELAQACRLL